MLLVVSYWQPINVTAAVGSLPSVICFWVEFNSIFYDMLPWVKWQGDLFISKMLSVGHSKWQCYVWAVNANNFINAASGNIVWKHLYKGTAFTRGKIKHHSSNWQDWPVLILGRELYMLEYVCFAFSSDCFFFFYTMSLKHASNQIVGKVALSMTCLSSNKLK